MLIRSKMVTVIKQLTDFSMSICVLMKMIFIIARKHNWIEVLGGALAV